MKILINLWFTLESGIISLGLIITVIEWGLDSIKLTWGKYNLDASPNFPIPAILPGGYQVLEKTPFPQKRGPGLQCSPKQTKQGNL